MFPFRDHNPSRNKPFVNWVLIAINIIVFLSYIPILNDDYAISSFFADWAMVPAEITSGTDLHTALTSMFLHGGYMHLIGNMLFLWIFGDNVEERRRCLLGSHRWFCRRSPAFASTLVKTRRHKLLEDSQLHATARADFLSYLIVIIKKPVNAALFGLSRGSDSSRSSVRKSLYSL